MAFSDWHHDNKQFILALILLAVPIILGFFGKGYGLFAFVMIIAIYIQAGNMISPFFTGHQEGLPNRSILFKVFCYCMAAKCAFLSYGLFFIDDFIEKVINFLHVQDHVFLCMFIPVYTLLSFAIMGGYIFMAQGKSFHEGLPQEGPPDENINRMIEFREGIMNTMSTKDKAALMIQTSALDAMANETGPYASKNGQRVKGYVNGMLGTMGNSKGLEYLKRGDF